MMCIALLCLNTTVGAQVLYPYTGDASFMEKAPQNFLAFLSQYGFLPEEENFSGERVVVYYIGLAPDSTVSYLAGRVQPGACFSTEDLTVGRYSLCDNGGPQDSTGAGSVCDPAVNPICGYGTTQVSVMLGRGGVAPFDGITVIPGALFGITRTGIAGIREDLERTLGWVAQHSLSQSGRIIVILPFTGGEFDSSCAERFPVVRDIFAEFARRGIPVVTQSGNTGRKGWMAFPACVGNTIAVGGTDEEGAISPLSSRAPIDGVDTYFIREAVGFSPPELTAAVFAGMLARLMSQGYSLEEILRALRATADLIYDKPETYRRLSSYRALWQFLQAGPVSLEDMPSVVDADAISMYPNPLSRGESLAVECVACTHIELYDNLGRRISQLVWWRSGALDIPQGLAPGVYFVRFTTPKGVITKPLALR